VSTEGDLSNALQQLADLELDKLLAATRHEPHRRGKLTTSAPEIRPATHIGAGERASEPSIARENRPKPARFDSIEITKDAL